jgi:hypothetical protein
MTVLKRDGIAGADGHGFYRVEISRVQIEELF